MIAAQRQKRAAEPIHLHEHALDNLRFIRDTMERAGAFTAVPGWGGVAMGLTAIVAAYVAGRQTTGSGWLRVWIAEAIAAIFIGAFCSAQKARSMNSPLWSAPARKLALAFCPPLLVGAVMTIALASSQLMWLIPGVWLCMYGVAVMGAGAFSVPIVPVMGTAFIALGCLSFLSPREWGDIYLALGFGGLHLGFGLAIAQRHGG
jgi:hypothetical protein